MVFRDFLMLSLLIGQVMNKLKLALFNTFYKYFWYKKTLKYRWKHSFFYLTWDAARSLAFTDFIIEEGKSVAFHEINKAGRSFKFRPPRKKLLEIISKQDPTKEILKQALAKDIPNIPLDKQDI